MPWILITSGRGPLECQRFAHLLLRELQKECAERQLGCEGIHVSPGEADQAILSALLSVDGPAAADFVDELEGTHKWICQSPFRPNHGRKNWYAAIKGFDVPEITPWRDDELRIETFRSSGPGGQHANKTSSAVRVTHVPTGLSVVAQEERSQHRNRRLALARMRELWDDRNQSRQAETNQSIWLERIQIERGNEKRVYVGEQFRRKRRKP